MPSSEEFLWSDAYLIIAEENFDRIFSEIYECELIDHIFDKSEIKLTKEDFVTAVAGDFNDSAKCDWLFSPVKLRNIFMTNI